MKRILLKGLIFSAISAVTLQAADFSQFVNNGLVGVGRIPANTFDQLGNGVDTLGGIFSSLSVDLSSIKKTGNTYSGTLFGLPDRGFGDGAQDYHPRIQTLDFSITPYTGAGVVAQNQITMRNTPHFL